MNTKALRQKILDLAIHGKLLPLEKVEQIRKDEPASILLEKIRADRTVTKVCGSAQNGKSKRDKNDSFIFVGDDKRHYEKFANGTVKDIEDEIPFEVPEGWSWCRLRDVVIDIADIDHKMPKIINDGIPFISPLDFTKDGKIDFINAKKISREDFIRLSRKVKPKKNDIIFPRYGTIGILRYIDTDNDFLVSYSCATIVTNKINTVPLYIFFALQSSLTLEEIEKYKVTTTQSNIGIKSLKQFFLPLPPLTEQQLIVEEIEKIFAQIDLLEQNKTDLQTAIKQAKAKILDLAIHGKLVPQDSNDEPASVLLEKIRAEKEEKIAKGEIKRDKNDSYIYKSTTDNCHYEKFTDGSEEEVEVPFELPETWSWCLFGEIAIVINGKNQSKVENPNGQYPIYGSGGIMGRADDYICPENCTIIGRKGSINNPLFVTEKFWNVDTAFGLCTNNFVLPKYLFYFCKAFDFTTIDSSTTLPSLTKTNIQQILFPLPSLNEQTRIVSKIEELFSLLDNISLNLV